MIYGASDSAFMINKPIPIPIITLIISSTSTIVNKGHHIAGGALNKAACQSEVTGNTSFLT